VKAQNRAVSLTAKPLYVYYTSRNRDGTTYRDGPHKGVCVGVCRANTTGNKAGNKTGPP